MRDAVCVRWLFKAGRAMSPSGELAAHLVTVVYVELGNLESFPMHLGGAIYT